MILDQKSQTARALPIERVPALKVGRAAIITSQRAVPEETPVALVYDGSTLAVMMASPIDLADFALGFSLTEGIVESADEIASLDIVEHEAGVELRMWLTPGRSRSHARHRRNLIGPTGCGLCGIESLESAVRPSRRVTDESSVSAIEVRDAM